MTNLRKMVFAALVAVAAPLCAGCYVEPAGGVVAYGGYEPQYYDGYVVYYDGVGRPYYYYGNSAVYIDAGHPMYGRYVDHYRAYGPQYNRWYGSHGYRYRTYRASPSYRAAPTYRSPGPYRRR